MKVEPERDIGEFKDNQEVLAVLQVQATKELKILHLKHKEIGRDTQAGINALKRFKVQNGVAAHNIAFIHIKLGSPSIYMDKKRLVDALKHLHLAHEIYSKIGHAMGEATALFHIGCAYLLQNQFSSARRMAENGRAICHAVSRQISKGELPSSEGMIFTDQSLTSEMQAVFLTLLAHICIREDCLTEADKLLKKAIQKKNKYTANPSIMLGWLHILKNRLDKADTVFSDVLKKCREWKYTEEESEIFAYQGIIQLRRGNLSQADELLKQSRERGLMLYSEVDVVKALADVNIQKNNLKIAEELLNHAMCAQKYINSPSGQGNVRRSMGDLYFQQGKFPEALSAYQEAKQLHQVAQWKSEQIQDLARIGDVHKQQGNLALAEEAHAEAQGLQKLIS